MTAKKTSDKKKQLVESDPVNDLEDLIENGLPYDEVDEDDLIENDEGEASPTEQGKQDSPSDSDESEVLPDPDLPLEEPSENNEDNSFDISAIEDGLAQLADRKEETEESEAPETTQSPASDIDIPDDATAEPTASTPALLDDIKEFELPSDFQPDEPGQTEVFPDLDLSLDDLTESHEENQHDSSNIENDLAQISDRKKLREESAIPEITQNPADDPPVSDIPAEAVVAPEQAPVETTASRQLPINMISKIAAALGLTGMLIAALAIWLNMGMSDQLAQLRIQQRHQKHAMASVQKLAQEVEKLQWLQNQQAETHQSSNEAMQKQLNNLTTVVARKLTKQWQSTTKAPNVTTRISLAPTDNTIPPPAKIQPEAQKVRNSITPDVNPDQSLEQLVVAAAVGNIRSIASTKGEILYQLIRGSIVSKISRTRGWIQVRLENGKTGWGYHTIFKSAINDHPAASGSTSRATTAVAQPLMRNSKGYWAVNLVSVETETTAKKQTAYYQDMGINATYALIPIKEKIWYRILIPGFATEKDAIAYKNVLAEKYSISTWHSKMPPVRNL